MTKMEKNHAWFPPGALMSTEKLLENILGCVQVGEFAVVQPLSMDHCFILGYLLAWKLLLTFFKASEYELLRLTRPHESADLQFEVPYLACSVYYGALKDLPAMVRLWWNSQEKRVFSTVAVLQWRNWMLQLSTYLTHQNGSILEGLSLWKNNVDKRFEGVEDCMICFSVIHGSNYSLPKKACCTCKKKFHSACLYKWFTSSNKSTCPLCRETFF